MKLEVYADGGARGNPGNAGIGVCIKRDGKDIERRYKNIGIKTNNEAEYDAAYHGVERAIELGATEIDLYMDSQLVINQLDGVWKIKKLEFREIKNKINKLITDNNVKINYIWIARELNKEADKLSNVAMDNKL